MISTRNIFFIIVIADVSVDEGSRRNVGITATDTESREERRDRKKEKRLCTAMTTECNMIPTSTTLPSSPPQPGVSWNMHDMLMRLVPNLIIQFHGSHRRPSLLRTPLLPSSPFVPDCLSIVSLRAHTHMRPPERFSFSSLRGATFISAPLSRLPHGAPAIVADETQPRRSSSAGCLTLTRAVTRSTIASIIGSV